MIVYELIHVFYYDMGDMVLSPKGLGFFETYASARDAIAEYKEKPGFCTNKKGFSLRSRVVEGELQDKTFYEVLVYVHTEDYEFEFEVELGLYGEETLAQKALSEYCLENHEFLTGHQFVVEKIINKCRIGRKEWVDGYSSYEF